MTALLRRTALAAILGCVGGCTWLAVPTLLKSDMVIGRSMELGGAVAPKGTEVANAWMVRTVPNGTALTPDPTGIASTRICAGFDLSSWRAKYSYVGIGWDVDGESDHNVYDGMNTEGLTVDGQALRDSTYQAAPAGDGPADAVNLCFINFAGYVVSNYATVDEVVAALKAGHMNVLARDGHNEADTFAYVHWAIADRTHRKIVVEFINGAPVIHENTVGTMTNDPHFDWHLWNLNNYVILGTNWAAPPVQYQTEIGMSPAQLSHGANTLGLPGDYTPPARFVRAFYLKEFSAKNNQLTTVADARHAVTAVLDAVKIPKGVVSHFGNASSGPDPLHMRDVTYDYTQWNTIKVVGAQQYLYRTYVDSQWRAVNLQKVDWSAPHETLLAALDTEPLDITADVNNATPRETKK